MCECLSASLQKKKKIFSLNEFHALASTKRKAAFHNYNNSRWYKSTQATTFGFNEYESISHGCKAQIQCIVS